MSINTLTIKAQEALQAAFSVAAAASNQAVEPAHILAALIAEDDSLDSFLLSRVSATCREAGYARCERIAKTYYRESEYGGCHSALFKWWKHIKPFI